jgi:hypothetical protein
MTRDEIKAVLSSYQSNADYDLEDSIAKAKAFVVACRRMLSPEIMATDMEKLQIRVTLDPEIIRKELEEAKDFIVNGGLNSSSSSVFIDTSNYRS